MGGGRTLLGVARRDCLKFSLDEDIVVYEADVVHGCSKLVMQLVSPHSFPLAQASTAACRPSSASRVARVVRPIVVDER